MPWTKDGQNQIFIKKKQNKKQNFEKMCLF
jgi:hypothetical protein